MTDKQGAKNAKISIPYFHKDADGHFSMGGPGEPRPLYAGDRLARDKVSIVIVVEGPKCVTIIERLGGLGTCSWGGAGQATKTDWSPLAGRDVLIWPDNDPAGHKYASDVASKLQQLNLPASVTFVDVAKLALAAKGDVADWLAAHPGATLHDVLALPRVDAPGDPDVDADADAHERVPIISLGDLIDSGVKDPEWLIEGFVPAHARMFIAGQPKNGKSWLALCLAVAILSGKPFLGESTKDTPS